jgi:hypothetical protein
LTETQPAGYVDGLDAKGGVVISGSKRTDAISGITLAAFKDIVATGRETAVYHTPLSVFRVAGLPTNDLVSLVTPAVIFDEVTIKPPATEARQPLLSAHPYFAK